MSQSFVPEVFLPADRLQAAKKSVHMLLGPYAFEQLINLGKLEEHDTLCLQSVQMQSPDGEDEGKDVKLHSWHFLPLTVHKDQPNILGYMGAFPGLEPDPIDQAKKYFLFSLLYDRDSGRLLSQVTTNMDPRENAHWRRKHFTMAIYR